MPALLPMPWLSQGGPQRSMRNSTIHSRHTSLPSTHRRTDPFSSPPTFISTPPTPRPSMVGSAASRSSCSNLTQPRAEGCLPSFLCHHHSLKEAVVEAASSPLLGRTITNNDYAEGNRGTTSAKSSRFWQPDEHERPLSPLIA